jgi:hypothetical protein
MANIPRGYAALISVILISSLLLILTISANFSGFLSTQDIFLALERIEADQATRNCMQIVQLRMRQEPEYLPSPSGDLVWISRHQSCVAKQEDGVIQTMVRVGNVVRFRSAR